MKSVIARDLVKVYKVSTRTRSKGEKSAPKEVRALDGLSLDVEEGTVLSVLGPNGAGKTTLVRVLTTLLHALKTHGKRYGLATLCIGGGEASAMIVEAI